MPAEPSVVGLLMLSAGVLSLAWGLLGHFMPWLRCRWPPYKGRRCPPDRGARDTVQRSRLLHAVFWVLTGVAVMYWATRLQW
jgi:hypothetical protein